MLGRDVLISYESEIFRDRRRKQRIFVEKLFGTFSRRSGTFYPILPGLALSLQFQASSGNSDCANWPGYEAGGVCLRPVRVTNKA